MEVGVSGSYERRRVAVLNAPDATSRRNDGFPPSGHPRTNGEEFYEDVVVGREGGSPLEDYTSGRIGNVASVLDDK